MERELKKTSADLKSALSEANLEKTARRYGVSTPDELFSSIGSGRITASQVVQKLTGQEPPERRKLPEVSERRRRETTRGVEVKGVDNLLVRFSKCCNPVPGDEIIGYITRGRGISVHRMDCPNVVSLSTDPGRQIEVAWNADETASYQVEIEIEGFDCPNFLSNIMNTLSERKTSVEAVTARTIKNGSVNVQLVVDIRDVDHLRDIMGALRQVNGVLGVHRATPN